MEKVSHFSTIALLIGEPARATMLWKILDGRMHTATELAIAADLSAQNASMHLGKLVKAGLLSVIKRGRLKYYQFANPNVAYVMEAIANLVPKDNLVPPDDMSDSGRIKYCRTCYDHLAGKVGVAITDKLVSLKIIEASGQDFAITNSGMKWFDRLDISIPELRQSKRALARKCLDWSEKRPHISGAVGAALANKLFDLKWLQRVKSSRIVSVTPLGQKKIYDLFGLMV
ncbi:DNA-binding transcriptional regulator, ArsR family [Chryseolinea serpens]|uniref:DNA-binding transcriptional regulator, ArsR family n=1 Tax=Chryseolinea serpens TaxID=947013 RepID=A0A1M5MQZ3_9BACT|nr:winged helix-turn-helix domain-containing protein [Chryseolinea serpens]SHG79627.1 DNA-binding transcriptional regulator, ArsR family [Chryseolinea serpens]